MTTATPHTYTLSREQRIRSRKDFLHIQRKGKRAHGRFVTIISFVSTRSKHAQVGFTVSKTVGKAHERNFVKRRLRHIYREHQSQIPAAKIVIIALPKALDAEFADLTADILQTTAKLHRNIPIPFGSNRNFQQERVYDA